jgi:hypothetical protein
MLHYFRLGQHWRTQQKLAVVVLLEYTTSLSRIHVELCSSWQESTLEHERHRRRLIASVIMSNRIRSNDCINPMLSTLSDRIVKRLSLSARHLGFVVNYLNKLVHDKLVSDSKV